MASILSLRSTAASLSASSRPFGLSRVSLRQPWIRRCLFHSVSPCLIRISFMLAPCQNDLGAVNQAGVVGETQRRRDLLWPARALGVAAQPHAQGEHVVLPAFQPQVFDQRPEVIVLWPRVPHVVPGQLLRLKGGGDGSSNLVGSPV